MKLRKYIFLTATVVGVTGLVACGKPAKKQKHIETKQAETTVEHSSDSGIEQETTSDADSEFGEEELRRKIEETTGETLQDSIYVDMDHDGRKEMLGAFMKDDVSQLWFCSSDKNICKKISENDMKMDGLEFTQIVYDDETHIVLNTYREMGTGKNFSLVRLNQGEPQLVLENQYGYCGQKQDGKDVYVNVEAYDGMYDASIDGMILHTWKEAYIYFDGTEYKEYDAKQISEEDFMKYENASEILEKVKQDISEKGSLDGVIKTEYLYYIRENGIMNIQCNDTDESGNIHYQYYTLRYTDNVIENEIGESNDGQISEHMSGLSE